MQSISKYPIIKLVLVLTPLYLKVMMSNGSRDLDGSSLDIHIKAFSNQRKKCQSKTNRQEHIKPTILEQIKKYKSKLGRYLQLKCPKYQ